MESKELVESEVKSVDADAVFVGVGRELNIDNLDLEKAGIEFTQDKSKLIVNEYLQTTNKSIYAVGDAAGNYMFTHAAEMHAKIVLNNLFSPIAKKFDDKYISWVTFTTPEVATFGISEAKAKEKGLETLHKTLEHDDRAITDEDNGFVRLYIDKAGLIHGGTIVSNVAGEISQEVVLAMTNKISLTQIFNKVYAYPTAGRVIRSIAQDFASRKVTGLNIGVLKLLYKIRLW